MNSLRTFLGKPCKRGHRGERYFSNKACVDCCKMKKLNLVIVGVHPNDHHLLLEYAQTLKNWRNGQ